MGFVFYMSTDGRIKTQEYLKDGSRSFCLAESVGKGTLITEFDQKCEVVNQVYKEGTEPAVSLNAYLELDESEIRKVGEYKGIVINAKCKGCDAEGLRRELDISRPSSLRDVPVVPIFVCPKCKKKYYSLTSSYLKTLVEGNMGLFEDKEQQEIKSDMEAGMAMLQEYIIRIFASKRISRIEIG